MASIYSNDNSSNKKEVGLDNLNSYLSNNFAKKRDVNLSSGSFFSNDKFDRTSNDTSLMFSTGQNVRTEPSVLYLVINNLLKVNDIGQLINNPAFRISIDNVVRYTGMLMNGSNAVVITQLGNVSSSLNISFSTPINLSNKSFLDLGGGNFINGVSYYDSSSSYPYGISFSPLDLSVKRSYSIYFVQQFTSLYSCSYTMNIYLNGGLYSSYTISSGSGIYVLPSIIYGYSNVNLRIFLNGFNGLSFYSNQNLIINSKPTNYNYTISSNYIEFQNVNLYTPSSIDFGSVKFSYTNCASIPVTPSVTPSSTPNITPTPTPSVTPSPS